MWSNLRKNSVQNVASAKRPAAKGRRKTVKLTPSQVAISKRLGVPLEEYETISREGRYKHMEQDKKTKLPARVKLGSKVKDLKYGLLHHHLMHRLHQTVTDIDGCVRKVWALMIQRTSGKLRSGWEFVRADEYPDSTFPTLDEGRYAGSDWGWWPCAGKTSEELAKSREAYFDQRTADRNEALENDVLKEQHPSMPINQDRQTRVTFGGSNKD